MVVRLAYRNREQQVTGDDFRTLNYRNWPGVAGQALEFQARSRAISVGSGEWVFVRFVAGRHMSFAWISALCWRVICCGVYCPILAHAPTTRGRKFTRWLATASSSNRLARVPMPISEVLAIPPRSISGKRLRSTPTM
jgi:hypothetical protein